MNDGNLRSGLVFSEEHEKCSWVRVAILSRNFAFLKKNA